MSHIRVEAASLGCSGALATWSPYACVFGRTNKHSNIGHRMHSSVQGWVQRCVSDPEAQRGPPYIVKPSWWLELVVKAGG